MNGSDASNENYNIDFERIVELIYKYEQTKKSSKIKKHNEESTKKDFILPLFEALGRNVYSKRNMTDSVNAAGTCQLEK